MALVIFPKNFLNFTRFRHYLVNQDIGGVTSIAGEEQHASSPSIRWRISGSLIICERNKNILPYEGFLADMEGTLNTTLLPVGTGRSPNQLAKKLGSDFTDQYTLYEDIDMNKTIIKINALPGRTPLSGQKFSTPDGKCYIISRVIDTKFDYHTIKISPWTRSDYIAGTKLEFDNPVCEVRFASDSDPAPDLEFNRYATPTMLFVEA